MSVAAGVGGQALCVLEFFSIFKFCNMHSRSLSLTPLGSPGSARSSTLLVETVTGNLMITNIKPGPVIFSGDHQRLAKFYEAMTGLAVHFMDDNITVLGSETFELVIHSLSGEPATSEPPSVRKDSYIKPFFPVTTLSEAREKAAALGGQLRPRSEEWTARGFRACDATDPDGNVIQFREDAP
jgi:predicted enzyme related to lactoylglutathione lyase